MTKYLLDTNALIDMVILRDVTRHLAMEEIVSACHDKDDEILVPSLCLKDASYVLENSPTIKAAVPSQQERREISNMMREFVLRECTICAIDLTTCLAAQANDDESDYDDALVAESARLAKADYIISSDSHAFGKSVVPRLSPKECADMLKDRAEG